MGRRRATEKREINPDPVYSSISVERLINVTMRQGKKSLARRIVYGALEKFLRQTKEKELLPALERAFENAKPTLQVKSRRIGGATYQVPVEIPSDRQLALALRWIVLHARKKAGKSMLDALAGELFDCYQNQGTTVKKKEDTYRMAEANKAFAHFKW